MGEVAEMMLDGTLCEGCGVYMDDEAGGYPRKCSDCDKYDRGISSAPNRPARTECPTCGKVVKVAGLEQHMAAKHSPKGTPQ
jgi:Zn finger protein HypA/HybF involved in hydrogenase expression